MPVQIIKRLLTVEDYHKMGEAGILQERGIELINGEILEMSPIGSKHVSCVNKLNALLNALLAGKAIISIRNPIITGDYSEPEPDIAILKYREDFYTQEVPHARDVLLVIEVADSSVAYDREIKLPQYAQSGIPEFWLINLEDNEIELFWQPVGKNYKFRELLRYEDRVQSKTMEFNLPSSDIIGKLE